MGMKKKILIYLQVLYIILSKNNWQNIPLECPFQTSSGKLKLYLHQQWTLLRWVVVQSNIYSAFRAQLTSSAETFRRTLINKSILPCSTRSRRELPRRQQMALSSLAEGGGTPELTGITFIEIMKHESAETWNCMLTCSSSEVGMLSKIIDNNEICHLRCQKVMDNLNYTSKLGRCLEIIKLILPLSSHKNWANGLSSKHPSFSMKKLGSWPWVIQFWYLSLFSPVELGKWPKLLLIIILASFSFHETELMA